MLLAAGQDDAGIEWLGAGGSPRQRLAVALRVLANLGYEEGPGGHAVARHPHRHDWMWMTPLARPFQHLRSSDLLLVDASGQIVEGDGIVNEAAFVLQSAVLSARPDVAASVHVHGTHGMAWSALRRTLSRAGGCAVALGGRQVPLHPFAGSVLDADADVSRLTEALGSSPAIILENHGVMTVGGSVEAAVYAMICIQTACEVQLLVRAAARRTPVPTASPRALSDADAQETWCAVRPYFERVVRANPEVLE